MVVLYSRNTYTTIHIYMRKHSQHNNDERTQFFRKIYLLLYSKWLRKGYQRVICERWVGDWTKTATYWTSALLATAALLSRSAGLLNRWPWGLGAQLLRGPGSHCFELQPLTLNSDLQLTWTSYGTGLYNFFDFHLLQWASYLHLIQPVHSQGYSLISSTGCTCYLHRCISYLTARSGQRLVCYSSTC